MARTLSIAAAALLCATAARADDPPTAPPLVTVVPPAVGLGEHWGVISAVTDEPGHDVFSAELGFPGASLGYTHGIDDHSDWGVKLDVLYSVLGTTTTQFGGALRIPLRTMMPLGSKLTLLLHADPGLFTYPGSSSTPSLFGVLVPVGAAIGILPIPELRFSFAIDVPLGLQLLHNVDFYVSPQFGFSSEYFIDPQVSVGINLRLGPTFVPTATSNAELGLLAQVTLGYRM